MPVRYGAIAVSIAATLLLAACGKSVSGSTYADASKTFKIEFQSGGKAIVSIGGQPADCTYEEKDKSITLTSAGQPAVFTMNDDGSLTGPAGGMLGGTLTKQ